MRSLVYLSPKTLFQLVLASRNDLQVTNNFASQRLLQRDFGNGMSDRVQNLSGAKEGHDGLTSAWCVSIPLGVHKV